MKIQPKITLIGIISIILIAITTVGVLKQTRSQEQKPESTTTNIPEFSDIYPTEDIKIEYPFDYTVIQNTQDYYKGTFITYELNNKLDSPALSGFGLYNKTSIQEFNDKCQDPEFGPCSYFGKYPDLKLYQDQKLALQQNNNLDGYQLKKFNDRNFLVSTYDCIGDSCQIREYTTFINDTKIDFWITMYEPNQTQKADQLFKKIKVTEKISNARSNEVIKSSPDQQVTELDQSKEAQQALTNFFDTLVKKDYQTAINYTPSFKEQNDFWDQIKIYSNEQTLPEKILESYCNSTNTCLKAKVLSTKQVANFEYELEVQFLNPDGSIYVFGPCCGATEDKMPSRNKFKSIVKKIDNQFIVTTPPIYRP